MPPRLRVLFATEAGVGRGHVTTLRLFAEAFGQELSYDAALHNMGVASELSDLCEAVFQGPGFVHTDNRGKGPGRIRTATWGEYLADLGFRDARVLIRQIDWWRQVIWRRNISIVVGDFAPCALLAARSMGIISVAMATGYEIPADGLKEFPIFLPDHAQRLYDEQEMVAAVNTALAHFGTPPIRYFPQIYDCSAKLVRTIPLLDSYAGLRTEPLLAPVEPFSVPETRDGQEIYAYFSNIERDPPELIEALCALDLPLRVMIPRLPEIAAAKLRASGAIVQTAFSPLEDLAARTKLMVNNGQHLTICMGLAAGLPQVCLPQHLEQTGNARRLVERGAGRIVEQEDCSATLIRDTIVAAYHNQALSDAARALMPEVRADLASDTLGLIRARISPLIAARLGT